MYNIRRNVFILSEYITKLRCFSYDIFRSDFTPPRVKLIYESSALDSGSTPEDWVQKVKINLYPSYNGMAARRRMKNNYPGSIEVKI